MKYKIQLNQSGSHSLEVTDENMRTIQKYALFADIVSSNGYVDEEMLDKLKFNVRSLIVNSEQNSKELLELCLDIIYHDKMKAFGLQKLMEAYQKWEDTLYENELIAEI